MNPVISTQEATALILRMQSERDSGRIIQARLQELQAHAGYSLVADSEEGQHLCVQLDLYTTRTHPGHLFVLGAYSGRGVPIQIVFCGYLMKGDARRLYYDCRSLGADPMVKKEDPPWV